MKQRPFLALWTVAVIATVAVLEKQRWMVASQR